MKKQLFLLFTLLSCFTSAWGHDVEIDGIYYNLYKSINQAKVTYKGEFYDEYPYEYSGVVKIPETVTVNGITYSVTGIENNCFRGCSGLTSITIPNSVTSLGYSCFCILYLEPYNQP